MGQEHPHRQSSPCTVPMHALKPLCAVFSIIRPFPILRLLYLFVACFCSKNRNVLVNRSGLECSKNSEDEMWSRTGEEIGEGRRIGERIQSRRPYRILSRLWLSLLSVVILGALEQHRFERHRSTYLWIFFSKYVLRYHPWLVESKDAKPGIRRASCKVIRGFSTTRGLASLTPILFKDQLYQIIIVSPKPASRPTEVGIYFFVHPFREAPNTGTFSVPLRQPLIASQESEP